MTSDVNMQNLLTDVTDALLVGDNIDSVRWDYDMPRKDSDELLHMIERIHQTMVVVEPSPKFARNLNADLLAGRQAGVMGRLRGLPARVQVAAVAAILGGFMLILRRLFLGESVVQHPEENALQEKV